MPCQWDLWENADRAGVVNKRLWESPISYLEYTLQIAFLSNLKHYFSKFFLKFYSGSDQVYLAKGWQIKSKKEDNAAPEITVFRGRKNYSVLKSPG